MSHSFELSLSDDDFDKMLLSERKVTLLRVFREYAFKTLFEAKALYSYIASQGGYEVSVLDAPKAETGHWLVRTNYILRRPAMTGLSVDQLPNGSYEARYDGHYVGCFMTYPDAVKAAQDYAGLHEPPKRVPSPVAAYTASSTSDTDSL